MLLSEHYRALYEYEKDCDHKMLAMLESVPAAHRGDTRFQQAVTLAAHLAACREFWLGHMEGRGSGAGSGWDKQCDPATLPPRFAALQKQWTDYLARLDAEQLALDFEIIESNGERFHLPVEVQVVQLFGHASYHRGQIALLVDQLGGETVDTDYVEWWWALQEENP